MKSAASFPEVIFHVGMGKTGTSSIQSALQNNSEDLLKQNAEYLGMWFGIVDEKFDHFDGVTSFFSQSPEDLKKCAAKFYEFILARSIKNNTRTFIFSNEAIFAEVNLLEPFFTHLCQLINVKIICFIRDPYSWLPSAYLQWGVRHKTQMGEISSFGAFARSFVQQYDLIQSWDTLFGKKLEIIEYKKSQNVELEFGKAIGVSIIANKKRELERSEDSEYILRALFNNRYEEMITPDHFDDVVLASNRFPPPRLSESINRYLNFNEINAVVSENMHSFDFIKNRFGYDFLDIKNKEMHENNEIEIRNRLIDYLMEITLGLSTRLKVVERLINENISGSIDK